MPRAHTTSVELLTGLTYAELRELAASLPEVDDDDWTTNPGDAWMTPEQEIERIAQRKPYIRVPTKLFVKLQQLVERLQRPWTPDEIREYRWGQVRRFLDSRRRYTYEEACQRASVHCEGTRATAGPRMMGRDYRAVEKSLPKKEQRSRTYGGRRPDRRRWIAHSPQQSDRAFATLIVKLTMEFGPDEARSLCRGMLTAPKLEALFDLVDSDAPFSEVVEELRRNRGSPPIIVDPITSATDS